MSDHSSEGKLSSSDWVSMRAINPPKNEIGSTEQIGSRRTKQITGPTASRPVTIPSNDTRWRTCQLAADQACGTSQLVGDSFNRYAQRIAVGIALSTII